MSTEPSGEAKVTSDPPHGPPATSLGNEASNRSEDSSAGGSQGQVPLPADVSTQAESPAASSEPQDIGQAPFKEAESTSGDQDQNEAAPANSQEKQEEVTALQPQGPGTLQLLMVPPNPDLDPGTPETRVTQGRVTTFLNDSDTPQKASVPQKQLELALSPPDAEAPPSGRVPQPNITIIITEAEEEKADPYPMAAGEDLLDDSRHLQAGSWPATPAGSVPASPSQSPHAEALGRRLLDSTLYAADENHDYMRSMTSLLGGGESSISSLADILVWPDTTMGMSVAVSCLASGVSSPAELLHIPGPSLRSLSSILMSTNSAFSRLVTGTGSALRSVTHALGSAERRTSQGMRSVMRYLISHLPPRRAHAGRNSD